MTQKWKFSVDKNLVRSLIDFKENCVIGAEKNWTLSIHLNNTYLVEIARGTNTSKRGTKRVQNPSAAGREAEHARNSTPFLNSPTFASSPDHPQPPTPPIIQQRTPFTPSWLQRRRSYNFLTSSVLQGPRKVIRGVKLEWKARPSNNCRTIRSVA